MMHVIYLSMRLQNICPSRLQFMGCVQRLFTHVAFDDL